MQLAHAARDLLRRVTAHPQPEGDVPGDVAVLEERVILEYEPDAAAVRWDAAEILAVEQDAAGVERLQSRDRAQKCRLPGAARAEHGHDLPLRDLERGRVERRVAVEAHRRVLDTQHLEPPTASHAQTVDEQDGQQRQRHQHDRERVGLGDVQLAGAPEEPKDRDR